MKKILLLGRSRKHEKGYTLLEYCAGAAIIAGVVFTSLNTFGEHMKNFFGSLGKWVEDRGTELNNNTGHGGGSGSSGSNSSS